jgi:hypothetical protein
MRSTKKFLGLCLLTSTAAALTASALANSQEEDDWCYVGNASCQDQYGRYWQTDLLCPCDCNGVSYESCDENGDPAGIWCYGCDLAS